MYSLCHRIVVKRCSAELLPGMVIGVDAGALSIRDERLKTGVWRVTYELLKRFSSLDTKNFYRLYSFLPISKRILKDFGNRMVNIPLMPSLGYMTLRLPVELTFYPVDVFLGLSQILPFKNVKRSIPFVYDLGFLLYKEKYGLSAKRLTQQTAYAVKHADQVITISKSVQEDIVHEYHIPKSKIQVCYPGVSEIFTSEGSMYKKSYPYFLFVGSLWKGKNIPTLLHAYHTVVNKGTIPHHLIIVGGDYWPDKEIPRTVEKLHLEKRVHMLGHVNDEELAKLYRGATAFVTTTLTEGFCLPIVEAMACRCPVIASDIGPVREISGTSGILVDPCDTEGFVEAMRFVSTSSEKRNGMKDKGLMQSTKFSWNTFSVDVLKVIQS